MFDSIDIWMMSKHQSAARLIGLYTPFERKDVLDFNMWLMKMLFCIYIPLACIAIITAVDAAISCTYFMLIAYNYFNWAPEYKKLRELGKKNQVAGVFPEEIITRKGNRYDLLFILLFSTVLSFAMYHLLPPILSFPYEVLRKSYVALIMLGYTFLLQEYLLCTMSPPPGEKQKRREEKEMRNMASQKN